jgi:hypothetical protein
MAAVLEDSERWTLVDQDPDWVALDLPTRSETPANAIDHATPSTSEHPKTSESEF